jgi:predicted small lipoprotein YifL
MLLRALLILLVAAVALPGCGRRGELEAPPGATAQAPAPAAPASIANSVPGATTTQSPSLAPLTSPVAGGGISPLDPGSTPNAATLSPPPEAPRKRFLLDFLL